MEIRFYILIQTNILVMLSSQTSWLCMSFKMTGLRSSLIFPNRANGINPGMRSRKPPFSDRQECWDQSSIEFTQSATCKGWLEQCLVLCLSFQPQLSWFHQGWESCSWWFFPFQSIICSSLNKMGTQGTRSCIHWTKHEI